MNAWPPKTKFALLAFSIALATVNSNAGPLKSGDSFPRLEQFQLEGSLPATREAKVVLVDFWASWCAPCKQSFAALNELHKRFGPEGLVIIAVNVDEKQPNMARFLAKHRADFAVVRDPSQKLVATLAVESLPASFIIDRDGKIHHVHRGFRDDETPKQYEQEIAALLRSVEPKP